MDMAALQRAVQGQLDAAKIKSSMPELAALYTSEAASGRGLGQTAESSYNAGIDVERQKEARALAEKRRAIMEDPNSWRVQQKEDGGYDFFDPTGKQVDIATYAQATNQKPYDIVKSSDNPIDMQYTQDYNYLTEYIEALQNKDKGKVDAMRSQDPRFSNYDDVGGIDRLLNDFKNYYKRYYTTRDEDKNAWGARPEGMIFRNPDAGGYYSDGGGMVGM
jgi:hypothetical protein